MELFIVLRVLRASHAKPRLDVEIRIVLRTLNTGNSIKVWFTFRAIFNFLIFFQILLIGFIILTLWYSAKYKLFSLKGSLRSIWLNLSQALMPIDIENFWLTFLALIIIIIPIISLLTARKTVSLLIIVEWIIRLAYYGSFDFLKLNSLINNFLGLSIINYPPIIG